MRVPVIALVALFLTFAADRARAQTEPQRPLLVAVYEWAPYSGEDLPHGGFAVEFLLHALKENGYEAAIAYVPFARAIRNTRQGVYDIIPGIWYTAERNQDLNYTHPITENKLVIISHRDTGLDFKTLEDLRGMTVGIARDYAYPDSFMSAESFAREPAKSLRQNLRKLMFKRIAATIGDKFVAQYNANQMFKEAADLFHYSDTVVESKDYHVVVSRKFPFHDKLVRQLNKTFRDLREDGTYERILKRHLSGDMS